MEWQKETRSFSFAIPEYSLSYLQDSSNEWNVITRLLTSSACGSSSLRLLTFVDKLVGKCRRVGWQLAASWSAIVNNRNFELITQLQGRVSPTPNHPYEGRRTQSPKGRTQWPHPIAGAVPCAGPKEMTQPPISS